MCRSSLTANWKYFKRFLLPYPVEPELVTRVLDSYNRCGAPHVLNRVESSLFGNDISLRPKSSQTCVDLLVSFRRIRCNWCCRLDNASLLPVWGCCKHCIKDGINRGTYEALIIVSDLSPVFFNCIIITVVVNFIIITIITIIIIITKYNYKIWITNKKSIANTKCKNKHNWS